MRLCNHLLPRPSTSSLVDNRAHAMVGHNQAPDLEGLHREMARRLGEENGHLVGTTGCQGAEIDPSPKHIKDLDARIDTINTGTNAMNGESLKDYIKHFNQAVLEVEDASDKVVFVAMVEGLHPGPLFDSLSRNIPKTQSALQSKVDKYIAKEELAETKRRRRGRDNNKRNKSDSKRAKY
ncbi:hypothetical protein Acr_18g0000130 [Actinidia rufa]|uniref:Uncharacterized protein n=1 Tax=Actinidia rufa TaxID=165716 RepID=A0A7J0G4Z4_9ERIC|nr:hypothetical protein Acr_18g0000130 [Actinidia rufa]